jgi:3-oxoacyl-[acyl-carrier-protein] synthase II
MNAANHRRRVVITGIGAISPLGNSPTSLWDALAAERSGVDYLKLLPQWEDRVTFGGEARGFTGAIDDFGELTKDLKKTIRKALKVMCRETLMAVAAAQQAVADAGFADQPMDAERSGVVFGSDYMLSPPDDFAAGMIKCGAREGGFQFARWGKDGLGEMNPLWMLKFLPNMPASHVAIFNDLRGPNNSLTLREVASLAAIREATQTIARGHADRMIAGATGTRLHPFKTVHVIQTEQIAHPQGEPAQASRPFDARRTGMVAGEGAGAILLEELESARNRGATIYGEIVGSGSSAVADARLAGRRDLALANAARAALAEADVSAERLGHVNAHGLGTKSCDADEAKALAEVLGGALSAIPVVAAKSYFGNLGSGSGVVELIASLLAMRAGRLFRTLNFDECDPQFELAVTKHSDIPAGECFLKLSVTPQAQAAALVVSRCE